MGYERHMQVATSKLEETTPGKLPEAAAESVYQLPTKIIGVVAGYVTHKNFIFGRFKRHFYVSVLITGCCTVANARAISIIGLREACGIL